MSLHDLMVIIIVSLLIVTLPAPGLYKMFEKAGIPGWKALIPFYNTWVMLKTAKLRTHWFFWQFIPLAGWFISLWILIEFVKLFGKFRFIEHAVTALAAFAYFPYIGFSQKEQFLGVEAIKKHKKTTSREWIDAGVFAVVAATLIRTFVFEAYTIPTPSMERTLLVNDFLFVSKLSYGPRLPNTPLAIPFVHHTIPGTNMKSYVEWIKIPYRRWFPSPVKRNDVVVFNFPVGDTVINRDEFQSKITYYDEARELGNGDMNAGRQIILNDPESYPLVVRPVDKRENYIKRCVGISGDTLQVKEGIVYINSKATPLPLESEMYYEVVTKGQIMDEDVMKSEYELDITNTQDIMQMGSGNRYLMLLTAGAKAKMLKNGFAKSIELHHVDAPRLDLFPHDTAFHWQVDNYGPVWIPKKGATLTLTPENYPLYQRVIRVYEKNDLERRGDRFFINGKETNQYTFKMNYYWMMGDNRHDSQDSRFWGFVPEDHIVGEAWMIWMSWNHGPRWSRLFKMIH